MMGQLERRAEAISEEFNSQAVACMRSAYEMMGRMPGDRVKALLEPATLHSVRKRKDRDGETRN
jgi:hypothetical protein